MTTWPIVLQDERRIEIDNPYGYKHQLSAPASFEAEVILSPINERIQVVSYKAEDHAAMAAALDALARKNGYTKVWAKVRADERSKLETQQFVHEATIPGYYHGEDAHIMARFLSEERSQRKTFAEEDDIMGKALEGTVNAKRRELPEGYSSFIFSEADAPELAALYAEVFPTYPYPISEQDYLVETARTHVVYRLVRNAEGKLVAAASAETVPEYKTAEMTDFASLPSERGKGLAQYLLHRLEDDARERFNIQCYYTIARALSFGMLRTFHNGGYLHTGTLVNNCSISGQFETMHVLCKPYRR